MICRIDLIKYATTVWEEEIVMKLEQEVQGIVQNILDDYGKNREILMCQRRMWKKGILICPNCG